MIQPKSGLDVTAAKGAWTGEGDQFAETLKKNSLVRCLTPELSRTALRHGGVLHDSA